MPKVQRVDLTDRVKAKFSVSNFLMAASYDDAAEIYTLADLSVAVLFEIKPIASSVMTDHELEAASDAIANAISRIKPPAYIQTIIIPSSNVEEEISNYIDQGGEQHPLLAMHAQKTAENFRLSVKKPLYTLSYGEGGFRTKRYRVLFAVVIRPDEMVGGAGASITDFLTGIFKKKKLVEEEKQYDEKGDLIAQAAEDDPDSDDCGTPAEKRFLTLKDRLYAKAQEASRRIQASFRTNHIPSERVKPGDLLSHFSSLLSPVSGGSRSIRWDPYQPLANQIPQNDILVESTSGSIITDGVVYKVLSLSSLPRSSSPGAATLPQAALSYYTLLDFVGDGFICVNASARPRLDVQKYAERRKTRAINGYVLPTKKDEVVRDCNLVIQMTDSEKRLFFDTQVTLCIFGRSEQEVHERASTLRDKAAEVGLECRIEQSYAQSLFFQSLPFGFAPTVPEARRLFLLPDRMVSDLMPIYMYSRGSKTGQVLLHNRLGEPFRYSFFDSPNAAHVVVAGESGSGKSFWVQNYIYNALRVPNSQAFIIDKGKSYATVTSMLGSKAGDYNPLGLTGGTCINAFGGTLKTSAAYLREFISHLCNASMTDRDRLNGDEKGVVDDCIRRAFRRKLKEDVWVKWEEIHKKYPKGAWVDKARKRMHIFPLEEGQWQRVAALKSREMGREPQFEIYHRALIHKRLHTNLDTGELLREEIFTDARGIDKNTRTWLENQKFRIEDYIGPEGLPVACVLYENKSAERTLEMEGFTLTPIIDRLVLEAEREADIEELEDCEIKVDYPEEWMKAERAKLLDQIKVEYPKSSEDIWAEMLDQRASELRPRDLFTDAEGYVFIQNEVFFRDFIRELKETAGNVASSIASRLSAFHGDGTLAGVFDGPTKFTLEGRKIVTFELGEIASAGEHLLAAVVGNLMQMLLLYCQSEHLPDGGPRSFDKYIVMDEFWQLLEIPMVFELVKNGLKTLRKHQTSMILISQRIREFADSENGRMVLGSVQHRVILRQQEQDVATFGEALGWSQEKINLMYSVHSSEPRGLYSEALIDCTTMDICEVTRLVANPYSYWLFTTTPKDLKYRDKMKTKFRGNADAKVTAEQALAMALDQCAKEYPNGTAASKKAAVKQDDDI